MIAAARALSRSMVVMVAVLTASGCSDSGDASVVDATSENPCTLVKDVEIQAVLRATRVTPGADENVQTTLTGERVCQFQATDDQGRASVLKMGLVTDLAGPLFDKYRAEHQQLAVVPDLGDRAVWNDAASTLVVLEDGKAVTVLVFGASVDDRRAAAAAIGAKAVERLR